MLRTVPVDADGARFAADRRMAPLCDIVALRDQLVAIDVGFDPGDRYGIQQSSGSQRVLVLRTRPIEINLGTADDDADRLPQLAARLAIIVQYIARLIPQEFDACCVARRGLDRLRVIENHLLLQVQRLRHRAR